MEFGVGRSNFKFEHLAPKQLVGDVSPRLAVEDVCRPGKLFDAPAVRRGHKLFVADRN
jgi:hypothetical protein